MNAMVIAQYGGPEALRYMSVPTPQPKRDEVLLRVRGAGVNRLDVLLRDGGVFRVPLPHIPGTDIVGTIEAAGEDVTGLQIGQRVLVAPILSCGECDRCRAGEDNLCESFGTVGSSIPGGYAEFVCVPARNAITVPDGMSDATAAALPLTYATASAMLRRAQLKRGETIVVLGATGGLGIAGMQLAKATGATVIGLARSPQHEHAVLAAGADYALSTPAFRDRVLELTNGKGAHVVFEHVGGATFAESLASLGMDGRMVIAGVTAGTEASIDLKAVFLKRLSVIGCRGSGRTDLLHALELWKTGKIQPIVQSVLPLEQAAEAHRLLETPDRFGRIVLTP